MSALWQPFTTKSGAWWRSIARGNWVRNRSVRQRNPSDNIRADEVNSFELRFFRVEFCEPSEIIVACFIRNSTLRSRSELNLFGVSEIPWELFDPLARNFECRFGGLARIPRGYRTGRTGRAAENNCPYTEKSALIGRNTVCALPRVPGQAFSRSILPIWFWGKPFPRQRCRVSQRGRSNTLHLEPRNWCVFQTYCLNFN
jgi:hypothetical protein